MSYTLFSERQKSLFNFSKKSSLILKSADQEITSLQNNDNTMKKFRKIQKNMLEQRTINEFLVGKYEIIDVLDKSHKNFSLYKIQQIETKELFLLKFYKNSNENIEKNRNCSKIINIFSLNQKEILIDETKGTIFVIFAYFNCVSFQDFLKNNLDLDEETQKIIITNLLLIQNSGNNIKTSNFLINPIDFSIKIHKNKKKTICDVWIIGLIFMKMNHLITMKPKTTIQKINMITSGEKLEVGTLSCEGNDLLMKMTNKIPDKRIKIEDALKHEWFE